MRSLAEYRGYPFGIPDARQQDTNTISSVGLRVGQPDTAVAQALCDHLDRLLEQFVQASGEAGICRHESDQAVAAIGNGDSRRSLLWWRSLRGWNELVHDLLPVAGIGDPDLDATVAQRQPGKGNAAIMHYLK